MARKVRIGIVGAGFAAPIHIASYRKVAGYDLEIAGLYGRTRDKAAHLAKENGIPKVYASYEEMLKDKAVDAVDLCVPNYQHAAFAIQAAQAGKHVFCEKPLTGYFGPPDAKEKGWTSRGVSRETIFKAALEQADRVFDAVTQAGVTFCYGENWVYAPPIQKARRLFAAGRGTILRLVGEESHSGSHAAYSKRWREAGGGSLLGKGCHPLGGALYLKYDEGRRRTGRPIRPKSVIGAVANLSYIESLKSEPKKYIAFGWEDVEDWGTMVVTFEDGSVAQITASDNVLGGISNTLKVYGSNAVVHCNINPNTVCQAYAPEASVFGDEYITEKIETKAGWTCPAPDEDWVTGYPDELRDFVGAVAEDRQPLSDLILAHDVLVLTYGAYWAAERGSTLDVTPYLKGR
jgi:predicted dehydrogenase